MSGAVMQRAARETILAWLGEVMDPEVPAVSVVDLGIVRDVRWQEDAAHGAGSPSLGACRAWDVESENWPQRGQFLPDLQAHSPAMGQEDGEKWTAAADLQPTLPKSDRLLVVTVTPTYSGCPATEVIAQSIREALAAHGVEQVQVQTQLSPAWTTDWMTAKGRDALRAYGIAPPVLRAPDADGAQLIDVSALLPNRVAVPCPLCASRQTRLLSQFGSTACKALYQCNDCLRSEERRVGKECRL